MSTSGHSIPPAPQRWKQESPTRTRATEADGHEARSERYSTSGHQHRMGYTYHHGALGAGTTVRTHLCGLCGLTIEVVVLTEDEYIADVPCGSVAGHQPPAFVDQRAKRLAEAMR